MIAISCPHCGGPSTAHGALCGTCGSALLPVDLSAIDTERFELLRRLFEAALQVPGPQRENWVVAACGTDALLAAQLRELLRRNEPTTAVSTPPAAPKARFIGPYRLLRELGQGGMGIVYLALRDDGAFQKQVALKLLLRDQVTPDFVLRFRNERQVLAALDHPNIARILDGGDTPDGMPYYVMEYVEGLPLDSYCEDRKLSLAARIRVLQQVCLAVDYLHRSQIIHRDLKPANILVSHDGVVKLLDFGIAKLLSPQMAGSPELTTAEGAPMTPLYASPEQMGGVATLLPASDVYALGVIAYKVVTGRVPFENPQEKLAQIHLGTDPALPSSRLREDLLNIPETTNQFRRRLIGDLDQIILMAMRRRPDERYPTAAALADDLERFLKGETVYARPGSLPSRMLKLLRRRRVAVAIAACFVLLLAGGGWQTYRVYEQGQEADRRFAEMRQLLDALESGDPQKASTQIQAVAQLRKRLETDLVRASSLKPKAAEERQQIVERSARFLNRLSGSAAGNPALAEEMAAAYQQIGVVQESTAGKESAMESYRAAAALLRALPPDRLRLTAVEQRVHFLEQRVGPWRPLDTPTQVQPPPAAPVVPARTERVTAEPEPVIAPPVERRALPALSAEEVDAVETRLAGVATKAQGAEQELETLRVRLQQQGMTLNPAVMGDLGQMRLSLQRARRQFTAGELQAARESLEAADVFATRVSRAAGR
jgi:serine/threonine protein kinase